MYRLIVGVAIVASCKPETGIQEPEPPQPKPTTPVPEPPPINDIIVLNEVMTANQSTINGPDTTSFPDWVELVNVGEQAVLLSELTLRNGDGDRWTGPAEESISPGERLIIWASKDSVGQGLNTGFGLEKNGDKLSLLDPYDRVLDFIDLDEIDDDLSYARTPDLTGEPVPTAWPTPGEVNRETASPTLNPADETLFFPYEMHRIDFSFTQQAYNNINAFSRPEVHVGVTIDGVHYSDVGLKLKGSASYQTMEGKPAFIVDFNEWVAGSKFRGLKAIKLHNGLVLDPTRNRDYLSYQLAREAGLMAPRVGWAEVYCNDLYYGLYMLIEKHDDAFIEYRRPGERNIGVILEPNESEGSGYGWGDFGGGTVSDWNMEEGPIPADPAVVEALQAADNLIAGPANSAAVEELWSYFDKDQFLTYMAWETMVMHTDGYRAPNNWRVFVDGVTHKIELVPSGAEWTWDASVDPWSFGGRAASWCLQNAGCTRDYAAKLLVVADLVESLDLATQFSDQQAWLNPYIQSDPRYQSWQNVNYTRRSTMGYLQDNPPDARALVFARFPDLQ